MSRAVYLVPFVLIAAIATAPVAAADDPDETISDLESQGYNVQINYVNGNSDTPLPMCDVTAVHNPNRSGGRNKTFTTVYVDVSCPDYWND